MQGTIPFCPKVETYPTACPASSYASANPRHFIEILGMFSMRNTLNSLSRCVTSELVMSCVTLHVTRDKGYMAAIEVRSSLSIISDGWKLELCRCFEISSFLYVICEGTVHERRGLDMGTWRGLLGGGWSRNLELLCPEEVHQPGILHDMFVIFVAFCCWFSRCK